MVGVIVIIIVIMEDNGMKITSVKGTNDYLPNEVEIRDYLRMKY